MASSIPKLLIRLPIAALGAGAGVTTYFNYKLQEYEKIPNYFRDLFQDFGTSTPYKKQTNDPIPEPKEPKKPKEQPKIVEKVVAALAVPDNELVGLTKKLIEIRNLLKTINTKSNLQMPSIVVIGSQSSGKSSVLEAIVGHEFLPKGSNMVTRRPIELTLIHAEEEYSEFPQLQLGKIKNFNKVQKTLTDLNLAVTDEECVSKNPIELRIHSPNVPDLTMVDLPGYIQVTTKNQPKKLKEKIQELTECYIQEPNIILAVCAADVDLANSEALRSSMRVDPLGLRTIGVITKMDLVSPEHGNDILLNKDYPLSLGYIGVVNKSTGDSQAMIKNETSFFKKHSIYDPKMVGSQTLRHRLMTVLETHMARSMDHIVDSVGMELDDARYQFKVHFNDRRISPESYVAECMDALKQRFKEFTKQFDKPTVRESITKMLEKKMLDITSNLYWSDGRVFDLPKDCNSSAEWDVKLTQASNQLTRSGVGKASVQLVVDMVSSKIQEITSVEPWNHHEEARKQVLKYATDLIRSKFHTAIDQVENTIKPYKFEVDATDLEWKHGQKRAVETLEGQVSDCQEQLKSIKSQVGRRKLRHAMRYLDHVQQSKKDPSYEKPKTNIPEHILVKAEEAIVAKGRLTILTQRLAAVKSRQCSTMSNKACCPEVFLSVVSEKLAATAVMFIYIELLNEFFFQLPREVDNKLYYSLDQNAIKKFCKENPAVSQHLTAQERKETLELVMNKLRDLRRYSQ